MTKKETLAANQPYTRSSGICGEGSPRAEDESDQALTQRKSFEEGLDSAVALLALPITSCPPEFPGGAVL